ncbi:MAG: hypothetical protein NTW21_36735 [Verrucomicrobia bacterium]|nr:hypothetical protein [Verrucomicrobiota bacterium]
MINLFRSTLGTWSWHFEAQLRTRGGHALPGIVPDAGGVAEALEDFVVDLEVEEGIGGGGALGPQFLIPAENELALVGVSDELAK